MLQASSTQPASYEQTSPSHLSKQKVKRHFLALLSMTNGAIWSAVIPIYQLLLPLQVAGIDAHGKIGDLALITFVAGIAALIAQPLTGALSDHTTSRFGRRKPWMLAGMLLTVGALVALAYAHNLLLLTIALAGFGFTMNMLLSALQAHIPDSVSNEQRAMVSALFGLAQPVGTLLGIIAISQIGNVELSYLLIAAVLFVVVMAFLVFVHEEPMTRRAMPAFSWKGFLFGFIKPLTHKDFILAWFARFWTIAAQTLLATYILFYLQDVHILPLAETAQGVATFQFIQTISLILTSTITGWLSDRLQRRKIFVLLAGALMTFAFLLLACIPSWTVVLCVGALFGAGFGIFIAGDTAVCTQVLPDVNTQGRDLGIMTAGAVLPEVLFPLIAWFAFTVLNGYPALFLLCATACVLGAVCILPIKTVR